jgi:hypothetical protein
MKEWRDLKDWVEASLKLENDRVIEAVLKGVDRDERYAVGYRNAFQDMLGMLVAFEKENE